MNRKHYNLLAADLAKFRPFIAQRSTREQRACLQVWRNCRYSIMLTLQENNPNFDWDRFIQATEQ